MKLLKCKECGDIVVLHRIGVVKYCDCGKTAGKYLNDRITAVVTKDCIILGIDNNSLKIAEDNYYICKGRYKDRVDLYFTGWIPTIPGEIVYVDTVGEVNDFDETKYTMVTKSTIPVKS